MVHGTYGLDKVEGDWGESEYRTTAASVRRYIFASDYAELIHGPKN